MCEILLFAANKTSPDPAVDRTCYKRGMPVAVFDDGHAWGREESKQRWIAEGKPAAAWPGQGKFVIIKVPGVPAYKASELLSVQTEDDTGVPYYGAAPVANPSLLMYRKRRWQAQLDALPAAVLTTLITDGEYTTTATALKNVARRIRDNATFSSIDGWQVTATFEKLAIGSNGADQNVGAGDGLYTGFANTSVSADYSKSGTRSLKINIPAGVESVSGGEFRLPASLVEGDEFWGRFYLYAPVGFLWDAVGPIVKLMRFPVLTAAGASAGYISILETKPTNYDCTPHPDNVWGYVVGGEELLSAYQFVCQTNTTTEGYLKTGRWEGLEIYFKLGSASNGILRIWHNNQLIWEKRNVSNIPVGGYVWKGDGNFTPHFIGAWNQGALQAQSLYIDDIKLTTIVPSNRDAYGNPMIGT